MNAASSNSFSSETASFELPSLADALDLYEQLQSKWVGWVEHGTDGSFAVFVVPERISELDELLAAVESWMIDQPFVSIRFHIDNRCYIMRRCGFMGRG